jgi:hypothetical protein
MFMLRTVAVISVKRLMFFMVFVFDSTSEHKSPPTLEPHRIEF